MNFERLFNSWPELPGSLKYFILTEKPSSSRLVGFQEEILDAGDLDLPAKSAIKEGEMKMALSLIDQLTEEFDVSKYKDTYTAELLKVIKAKAKGTVIKSKSVAAKPTATKDLMAQLKASLQPVSAKRAAAR